MPCTPPHLSHRFQRRPPCSRLTARLAGGIFLRRFRRGAALQRPPPGRLAVRTIISLGSQRGRLAAPRLAALQSSPFSHRVLSGARPKNEKRGAAALQPFSPILNPRRGQTALQSDPPPKKRPRQKRTAPQIQDPGSKHFSVDSGGYTCPQCRAPAARGRGWCRGRRARRTRANSFLRATGPEKTSGASHGAPAQHTQPAAPEGAGRHTPRSDPDGA